MYFLSNLSQIFGVSPEHAVHVRVMKLAVGEDKDNILHQLIEKIKTYPSWSLRETRKDNFYFKRGWAHN